MDYKAHISEIFDRSAPGYGSFGTHYFDIFAERLIKLAQGFKGAHILDVATGRGSILKRVLPQIGKEGKIIGIDLSPKMIEETRKQDTSGKCFSSLHGRRSARFCRSLFRSYLLRVCPIFLPQHKTSDA